MSKSAQIRKPTYRSQRKRPAAIQAQPPDCAASPAAFYGVQGIPRDWLEGLAMREFIGESADALFNLSTAQFC